MKHRPADVNQLGKLVVEIAAKGAEARWKKRKVAADA